MHAGSRRLWWAARRGRPVLIAPWNAPNDLSPFWLMFSDRYLTPGMISGAVRRFLPSVVCHRPAGRPLASAVMSKWSTHILKQDARARPPLYECQVAAATSSRSIDVQHTSVLYFIFDGKFNTAAFIIQQCMHGSISRTIALHYQHFPVTEPLFLFNRITLFFIIFKRLSFWRF